MFGGYLASIDDSVEEQFMVDLIVDAGCNSELNNDGFFTGGTWVSYTQSGCDPDSFTKQDLKEAIKTSSGYTTDCDIQIARDSKQADCILW
jgi:hypothetical protein